MKLRFPRDLYSQALALVLAIAIFAAPVRAQQQPALPPPPQPEARTKPEPTFDTLLSADSYKMYVEVRNVGTLLTDRKSRVQGKRRYRQGERRISRRRRRVAE